MLTTGGLWRRGEPDAVPEIFGARAYTRDGFVVAWFGRLDNLRECRRVCAVDTPQPEAVALALYQRWGVDGFRHLIGDFALSLWSPTLRRLVLAVDAPGRVAMYYRATPDYVIWSLSARRLASATAPALTPSEEYMAGFLTNRPSLDSPYQGVVQVPPASAVLVDPDTSRVACYWSPEPSTQLRYHTDRQYEEHFLSVFKDAVACRLPASGIAACELSGGIDSSTIVYAADRLIKGGATRCDGLLLLSYVFDQAQLSDERRYIDHVTCELPWPALQFSEVECPLLTPPDLGVDWEYPTGQLLFLSRQDRVAETMHERGASVVLSGIGGDQLFWSEPPKGIPLADLLYRGQWLTLRRSSAEWARALGWSFRRTLWRGAVAPVLALYWPRLHPRKAPPIGDWLTRDFVRRHGLAGCLAPAKPDGHDGRPSWTMQRSLLRQTMRPFALDRATSTRAVDVRYPYLDRRLIEFALALPLEQCVRPLETRSIVRRAFRGVMPERICTRTTKGGPDEALLRAVIRQRRWLDELFRDARTTQLGIVDPIALGRALQGARHGHVSTHITRTIALEIWLRSLTRDRASAGAVHMPLAEHRHGAGPWRTAIPSRN